LSQAFGEVPPGVPTEPVRTFRKNRQRAVSQPPMTPADERASCGPRGHRPARDLVRDDPDLLRRDTGLGLGVFGGVAVVEARQLVDE
jgi:hypothetical protein